MNIEELKLILETVESVAGTAGIAGGIWLVLHYGAIMVSAVAAPAAWVLGCVYGLRYVKDALAAVWGTKAKLELERHHNEGRRYDKHCKMFINEEVYQQFCCQVDRLRERVQHDGSIRSLHYIHEADVNRLRDAINFMEFREETKRKEQGAQA